MSLQRAFLLGRLGRLGLLGLIGVAGCAVEPIDLGDRQCDDEHPCAAEYTCVDSVCERTDELESAGSAEPAESADGADAADTTASG